MNYSKNEKDKSNEYEFSFSPPKVVLRCSFKLLRSKGVA